ncbi:hypothetical protein GCM10023191_027320 [Actinoallomurus oryzae]|uniref:Uncharacterized protein n=1 Tax=Actinoallomurus oryzae TaxID=502180 RepID=A0ABP8PVX7_9ACTN
MPAAARKTPIAAASFPMRIDFMTYDRIFVMEIGKALQKAACGPPTREEEPAGHMARWSVAGQFTLITVPAPLRYSTNPVEGVSSSASVHWAVAVNS